MNKDKNNQSNNYNRSKYSLAGFVLIFSLLATVLTAVLSYFILKNNAEKSVTKAKQQLAAQIKEDIVHTVKAFPAHDWLITYWYENRETMEVEYYGTEVTQRKAGEFAKKTGLATDYVTLEDIEAMSEEDQKLYAEIIYNQTLGLLNLLKDNYDVTYLSLLVTDPDYSKEVFLISGASPTQKRGTDQYDAYVLGKTSDTTKEQRKGMKEAVAGEKSLARFGDYLDAYGYVLDIMGGWHVIVDVVFDMSALTKEANSQVFGDMFLFILLQGGLALILFIATYFRTVRPINRIQKYVRIYREERNSPRVLRGLGRIHLKNEIGALSDGISDMVISIDKYICEIESITSEKEKIKAELSVATKIQAEMLPSTFPDRKEFDLYATMTPAKDVGGDFYDFFLIDDDHLALVIADVSGKGVPAALFMVNSKTRIQNQAVLGKSPSEILTTVNNQLAASNDSGYFVTVWIAIIDLKTGKGVAANAGHEHPVIRRANGAYETVVYKHSFVVGAMEGARFKEHEFELHPGDRLFVYTDGVPEATNAKEEQFGIDRMLASLNSHGKDTLQELLPDVKNDIDTFVGDAFQFDDLTMLGFDYYGPQENPQENNE